MQNYMCDSLVAQMVKNLPAMQETWVQSLVGKFPWRRKWQPTLIFLPGKSHEQKSLEGYNPWGHKESDTTERLTLFTSPWWSVVVFTSKMTMFRIISTDFLRSYQSFQLNPLTCYNKTTKQKTKSLNYSHLWCSSSLLSADWWSTHTPPFLSAGFDLIFAPHHRQHPEEVSWLLLHCSGHDAERGEEKRREWWLFRLCRGSCHHGPTEHVHAGCAQDWDVWQWERGSTASRNPTWSLLTKS